MPWHQNWLVDIDYNRVDLVKEGANSQAHIKLFKSKGENGMDIKDILAKMKPEHAAAINQVIKAKDDEIANMADDKKKLEDEVDTLKKASEEDTPAEQTEEEILKSVKDPAVKQLLETQIAKAKAAEEAVRIAKAKELETEAIAKAKEVPNLGAEEVKLAEVYKKLKDVDAELCEDVFGIFKAASAMVAEGGVLSEVGKSATGEEQTGGGSEEAAWSKIEQAATEVAKSRGLSQTMAISAVIKERPELYNEYIKAQVR